VPHRSKHFDKYDTQRFGHELADLGGASGANSQSFVEDPKLKAELGGQTEIAAIEETIAQYGTAQNAPSWLAAMFGKLKAMFGESVTVASGNDDGHRSTPEGRSEFNATRLPIPSRVS
jgi:hypothetical protein